MTRRVYSVHSHAVALRQHFTKQRAWAWSRLIERQYHGRIVAPPIAEYARDYLVCDTACRYMDWLLTLIDDVPKEGE